ncbi:beta-ketoacyl synthase N-terminal-like domain-containing protein [Aequorivita marina]|uniref:beta-ketoacyl synthase N-terminal-like domain-containing protein n=1 Tax=Aequorivita marina TaxID=3073654 RepID=UPI0028755601|nr:beta-ketoacyl synthase N-terminal-like domain-containing protein [Aequorivita sp. S2608]MDS1298572.1 beta-ketoacyl synthase N-terminal-like domain-containing protein [Aequorivita sp. S2608]
MIKTYLSYNSIFSSLGFDSKGVVENVFKGISGLEHYNDRGLLPEPFCASMVSSEKVKAEFSKIDDPGKFTKLEQMMILSLKQVIDASKISLDKKVGLIISTTKGNIDVLEKKNDFPENRAYLSELGRTIQEFFGFKNEAIVISNACVSGVLAVSAAKRFISEEKYDHVFITSGDLVTKFILSGFNSFQALSVEPCKPYDKNRVGINLGEVSASVFVTSKKGNLPKEAVEILGDATCNDANHISGPSRTGEGLYRSVKVAMQEANVEASAIDYISAHGTATSFNDEMEAIAFNRLGLENVPLNSLKGYFGHTLGASGLLETIVGMHAMKENILFSSKGFSELGVSEKISVIETNTSKALQVFLKTASGFGGCNTAVILKAYNTE